MHMKKKQIRFTDFSQMQRKQNGTGVVQKIKEKFFEYNKDTQRY